jgi:vitamin B12 transporter
VTTNLIDFVSCFGITTGGCATNTSGGFYANVAKAEAEGLELQADWRPTDRLEFTANYTLDDVEDRSPGSPTEGFQLARRPKNAANLSASYVWPVTLRTALAVRYAGDSFDDDAHTVPLKAYALLDVRLSYPVCDHIEVYARVENLTDTHYETTFQYGTLGRAAYGGLRVTF